MARLTPSSPLRGQLAAIARVRWQLFVNSLRTIRGRLEMVSRIVTILAFACGGLAGAFGLGVGSWFFLRRGVPEMLALLFWGVFLFWQAFPILSVAMTAPVDLSHLVRFPLRYPAFFLVHLAFGSLEPMTLLGCLWLSGMAIGIGYAGRGLSVLAIPLFALFAAFNVILSMVIFAWLERWLAQRRTREILGILFLLFMFSFQLVGPLARRFNRSEARAIAGHWSWLVPVERLLPPGLAGQALTKGMEGSAASALASLTGLCLYAVALLSLLHLRLRAQYHGESLSETVAPVLVTSKREAVRPGWRLPGFSEPVAAVFEKEIRYVFRGGPFLLTLLLPVLILVVMRFTMTGAHENEKIANYLADFAFPISAAYVLLGLSNLIYNCFGLDGSGFQSLLMAPIRFRDALLGKNLAYAAVMAFEAAVAWLTALFLFRMPDPGITLATIAGIFFAFPANLVLGNLLSVFLPKKYDFGVFGRQRASATAVLASLGVQVVLMGIVGGTLLAAYFARRTWIATTVFLALAAGTLLAYRRSLEYAGQKAHERSEILSAELCRE